LSLPHYSVYHTEHPDGTAHGGTAVIIRSSIAHHELAKFQQNFLQATTIEVFKLPTPLVISAVYCPPRHTLTKINLNLSLILWVTHSYVGEITIANILPGAAD
jgi:hypothetical protein